MKLVFTSKSSKPNLSISWFVSNYILSSSLLLLKNTGLMVSVKFGYQTYSQLCEINRKQRESFFPHLITKKIAFWSMLDHYKKMDTKTEEN